MKQIAILWAFAASQLNNHVLSAPSRPLAFKRGADDYTLIHLDYENPGRATFATPTGERLTEQLAEAEVGQLCVAYGRETGVRVEMPPLVGYGETQGQATAANTTAANAATGGGYGQQ